MPRTVSATKAKVRFGEMVDWAVEHDDDVIVESHGKPKAVIISYKEYQRVQIRREQEWTELSKEQLRILRKRIARQNQDLSREEADAIAHDVSREAIRNLVAEREHRYETE